MISDSMLYYLKLRSNEFERTSSRSIRSSIPAVFLQILYSKHFALSTFLRQKVCKRTKVTF
jgi:hypothetical protein